MNSAEVTAGHFMDAVDELLRGAVLRLDADAGPVALELQLEGPVLGRAVQR